MFSVKNLGGRKFTLVMVIVLITSLLTYFKIIDQNVYQAIIFMISSSYITGNVAQKYIEKNKKSETTTLTEQS